MYFFCFTIPYKKLTQFHNNFLPRNSHRKPEPNQYNINMFSVAYKSFIANFYSSTKNRLTGVRYPTHPDYLPTFIGHIKTIFITSIFNKPSTLLTNIKFIIVYLFLTKKKCRDRNSSFIIYPLF